MFFSPALLIAAMAAFVAATPIPDDAGNCNTGNIQCCEQVHDSQSAEGTFLASLVGVSVSGITGSIGAQCSPIGAIALSNGAKCTQQPVCCSNNDFKGLVVVGCSPITL